MTPERHREPTLTNEPATARRLRVAIVGMRGGVHVGESLGKAGKSLGHSVIHVDAMEAWRGPRLLRSFNWRFRDRVPLNGAAFASRLFSLCEEPGIDVLISTGLAPLQKQVLSSLRERGVVTMNYSTDDPWNRTQSCTWFLNSLPCYDVIFTTRRSNIDDFVKIGCQDVRYLPFGYDDALVRSSEGLVAPSQDVLFVGGADRDRANFMRDFIRCGMPMTLVGNYWSRYPGLSSHWLGSKSGNEVAALTRAAKVNLCLVRRANRDGHVMRSFEIAAYGGCMLAEDTQEHRDLFGPDGEGVYYFRTPQDAAGRADDLLQNEDERRRLVQNLRRRVNIDKSSYVDRLSAMLNQVAIRFAHQVA